MELQSAAGEIIVDMVPAYVDMVGVSAEIHRMIKLGRRRIDSGIMNFIAVKLYLVAVAHLKASNLTIGVGALHFISNHSPAGPAKVHRLSAAKDDAVVK